METKAITYSTEWAASWPREAEESLEARKNFYRRLLPGWRNLSEGEVYIQRHDNVPGIDGTRVAYSIEVSPDLAAELTARRQELEGQLTANGRRVLKDLRANPDRSWGAEDLPIGREVYLNSDYATGDDVQVLGVVGDKDCDILRLLVP